MTSAEFHALAHTVCKWPTKTHRFPVRNEKGEHTGAFEDYTYNLPTCAEPFRVYIPKVGERRINPFQIEFWFPETGEVYRANVLAVTQWEAEMYARCIGREPPQIVPDNPRRYEHVHYNVIPGWSLP